MESLIKLFSNILPNPTLQVSVMPAEVVRDATLTGVKKNNSYSAKGNDVEEIMIGFTLIGT